MPGSRIAASALALALCATGSTAQPVSTQPATVLADAVAARYIGPSDKVEVGGGRTLNLHCEGNGDTTVLFDSGGSDWSVIWALVQPAVAGRARACTYDRAGLGYSDPAMGPRTPFAIVEDMHALVGAAKLKRPLVLVGHSLGGFNVKLYAALYPEDVAGLVLVDPSEERDGARSRAFITERWGAGIAARNELAGQGFLSFLIDRYRDCAILADKAPLDPESLQYRRCTDPVRPALGPLIAKERSKIQALPVYQHAQASELAYSVYGDPRADATYANLFKPGMLGSRPLVVLAAKADPSDDPVDTADAAATARLHQESANLSTRGCVRQVERTGHNIEIDRPDAIIAAIAGVIAAARRPDEASATCQ